MKCRHEQRYAKAANAFRYYCPCTAIDPSKWLVHPHLRHQAAPMSSWSRGEAGLILDGSCTLSVTGRVTWVDQNRNYAFSLPVRSTMFDGDLRLNYRIGKLKASEPSLQILFRERCLFRLDVNQGHVEKGKRYYETHTHVRYEYPDGSEDFIPGPLDVRSPELGKRVSGTQYYDLLTDFAIMRQIDATGVQWTDPPEGRQP